MRAVINLHVVDAMVDWVIDERTEGSHTQLAKSTTATANKELEAVQVAVTVVQISFLEHHMVVAADASFSSLLADMSAAAALLCRTELAVFRNPMPMLRLELGAVSHKS